MKTIYLFLALIAFAFASPSHLNKVEKEWIKNHPKVLFAGDPNWLPFEAVDKYGNYIGIVAEYLQMIEDHTGLKFVIKPTKSWSDTLALASKQEVEVLSGDIADVRLNKNYKPIEPYLLNPIVIIMDSHKHYVDDLKHLQGKKIAIIKGYGYTSELFKNYPMIKFIEVENIQEGLKALALKKYDAMVASEILAYYHIRKMGFENIKIVGKTSVIMEVTFFVKKSQKLLYNILNKVVHHLPLVKKHDILNKWRSVKSESHTNIIIWILVIPGFAVVIILVYIVKYLYKSSSFYKEVLENTEGTLWSWDIKRGSITFSGGARNLIACSEDVFVTDYTSWMERIHDDDKKSVSELIKQNLSGKKDNFIIDYRLLNNKKIWVWLTVRAKTIYDKEGKALRMDGVCRDISRVKEHQYANEQSIKRLESAQEIGHLGSWDWNIKTGALNWSDEVYRIFGEEPQSFPATYEGFVSYIPIEYQAGLEAAIAKAMEDKKPYEYDHEVLRKDGSRRLVREAGYVLFDDNDEPQFMFGTILDINTVVEVNSTKRENQELNDLLKKFDENVIASNTDLNGMITYVSKAFSRVSGYSHSELIGHSHSMMRHPDVPSSVYKDLWDTIQAGKTWKGEFKNRRKDGSDYWVFNTISAITDENGKAIGYSAIRQDLTHEKEAEALHKSVELKTAELLALNQELEYRIDLAVLSAKDKDHLMAQQSKLASMGEMIGNIAHQWRQPLNAVALILQKQQLFFERGILDSDKIKANTDKGLSLINKMSTTIDDFRDFFKPNKEKTRFDIALAIDDTLSLIDAALYNEHIAIELDIEKDQFIFGYKNEFSQVLLNLINNAKDVLSELKVKDPKIQLKTYSKNSTAYVEVVDNGGGIEKKIMEHIFEPYFTTKEEGKGTGIGLYMSMMIIEENMGGRLEVCNVDHGAKFTISMPLMENDSAQS